VTSGVLNRTPHIVASTSVIIVCAAFRKPLPGTVGSALDGTDTSNRVVTMHLGGLSLYENLRSLNRAILLCCFLALSVISPNDVWAEEQVDLSKSEPPIAFFAPTDDRYIDYGESSFSVPRPLVIIDPAVLGSSRDYPSNTTVEQIGPDTVLVRITGRVYDFLSDMVADHHADIDDALRPYAFTGRFDMGEQELQIHTGTNSINVTATNADKSTGTATLSIRATVNREEGKYDIDVDVRNSMDDGLYKPILVHINDAEVTPDNIDTAYALLNGKRVGLRFVGGQLQLDRPIIGVGRSTPPDTVVNIVNVVGDADRFLVRYKDHEAVFTWSYTSR